MTEGQSARPLRSRGPTQSIPSRWLTEAGPRTEALGRCSIAARSPTRPCRPPRAIFRRRSGLRSPVIEPLDAALPVGSPQIEGLAHGLRLVAGFIPRNARRNTSVTALIL